MAADLDDVMEKVKHLEIKMEDDSMGCGNEVMYKRSGCNGFDNYSGYGHDQEVEMFEQFERLDDKMERRNDNVDDKICHVEKEIISIKGDIALTAEKNRNATLESEMRIKAEMQAIDKANLERAYSDKALELNSYKFGFTPVTHSNCYPK